MTIAAPHPALAAFKAELGQPDLPARLRAGLIGETARITGPRGRLPLLYADYVASGRALRQVEEFVMEHVLPYYANTHTETSFCGAYSTGLREAARAEIARILGAGPDCHVVFSGAGATAGLNRVVGLLNIPAVLAKGGRAVVLHGPYEHHSNILPWRESGAEVVEIAESPAGGPDMAALAAALQAHAGADLLVGTFSAMSNVTGIVTDSDAVTRLLKAHGALAIWDYAGGAPYLPMQMQTAPDAAKDAIIFSAHKFPGGPQASGVLVFRNGVVRRDTPTLPGGGTVAFVSPETQLYSPDVVAREEAGTPNVVGDIRAGLVLLVKEALGQDWITARNARLGALARRAWTGLPGLEILGNPSAAALPIFSFRIHDAQGAPVDHIAFTRSLSENYGIQARGGCSCAGPYGHRLLHIDPNTSAHMAQEIRAGHAVDKPGWVRVNLSYLLTDAKAVQIIDGIAQAVAEVQTIRAA
ncbi:aminotransferase class V-fold PLP-dependent enzyme [Tabrizicola oligotrophica]|uniref:Aminotransferase class V-fold PLP-dependent enzyme n=1 Tax=Tabrizicola oligotrophica TaxID=2710650 RepID=A0A6M0QTG5_9RHOB|nr:aminotransferase class V-fold PLP-dependent enzyme [Tabrizicola oligotrophica]NEY90697.1 aminotransferase class V-fold PLP-dependent enzyme [Tabrizicola oligotrophica]